MERFERHRHRRTTPPGLSLGVAACLVLLATLAGAELSPPAKDGHRPLRSNPAGPAPDPEPASAFTGYPEAPAFTVRPRQDELSHFPCAACHAQMPANRERRKLFSPHPGVLDHGDGRFWCLDCHSADSRNHLETSAGKQVGFDRADQVCASCHYAVHRDWTFGVHGKRDARWQGERTYFGCAHCHNPHDPAVRPRAPERPPPVRAGLSPMPDREDHGEPLHPWRGDVEEEGDHEQQAQ